MSYSVTLHKYSRLCKIKIYILNTKKIRNKYRYKIRNKLNKLTRFK